MHWACGLSRHAATGFVASSRLTISATFELLDPKGSKAAVSTVNYSVIRSSKGERRLSACYSTGDHHPSTSGDGFGSARETDERSVTADGPERSVPTTLPAAGDPYTADVDPAGVGAARREVAIRSPFHHYSEAAPEHARDVEGCSSCRHSLQVRKARVGHERSVDEVALLARFLAEPPEHDRFPVARPQAMPQLIP